MTPGVFKLKNLDISLVKCQFQGVHWKDKVKLSSKLSLDTKIDEVLP